MKLNINNAYEARNLKGDVIPFSTNMLYGDGYVSTGSLDGDERNKDLLSFLKENATFLKIAPNVWNVFNRGTGMFDENGFVKDISTFNELYTSRGLTYVNGDPIKPLGNFVCQLFKIF